MTKQHNNNKGSNSNKKKNKKKTVVKAANPRLSRPTLSSINMGLPMRSPEDPNRWLIKATLDPFDVAANGVKIPDDYACPTVTLTARSSMQVSTGSTWNNSVGASIMILPNPYITCINLGQTGGTTGTAGLNPLGLNLYSANNAFSAFEAVGQSGQNALASNYGAYRVVSAGITLRSTLQANASAGIITVAPFIPSGKGIPLKAINTNALNATTGMSAYLETLTGGGTNLQTLMNSAQIQVLPGAQRFTTFDVMETGVMLRCLPTDPNHLTFRPTASSQEATGSGMNIDLFTAGDIIGDWVDSSSTGVVNFSGNLENCDLRGMNGWVINVLGGTANNAILFVEIVLHLECTVDPGIKSSTGTTFNYLPTSKASTGTRTSYEKVLSGIKRNLPLITTVASGVATLAGFPTGPIDKIARAALGILT